MRIDEGYTKYQCDWRRSAPLPEEAIAELNTWRNRLHDAGLVGHYPKPGVGYGNVSVRAADGEFIISGTQTGHIQRTDARHYALVIRCDIQSNQVTCAGPVQASSEALTHAAIYRLDPDISAVVHVHSDALWRTHKDHLPTTDGAIAYGTPDMAAELQRLYAQTALAEVQIAVMAGHAAGIIAFGSSIADAAERVFALTEQSVEGVLN